LEPSSSSQIEQKTEKSKKKRQSESQTTPFLQPLPPTVAKSCSNCGATETALWRRTPEGLRECNPCQLHFQRYGVRRPLVMKSQTINRRKRRPKAYQPADWPTVSAVSTVSSYNSTVETDGTASPNDFLLAMVEQ
ncbi:hypothetical protein PMAYCL1PPCAC_04286, partial [Pristionchus mayeri]